MAQLEREVRGLRDNQEEEEFGRKTWEKKAEKVLQKVETSEKAASEEWKKELKETEKRIMEKLESEER